MEPKRLVKDGEERLARTRAELVALRFDGWREAKTPEPKAELAPGGAIILSGLLPEQTNAAVAAYRNQGLALVHRAILENWVTLVMRHGSK